MGKFNRPKPKEPMKKFNRPQKSTFASAMDLLLADIKSQPEPNIIHTDFKSGDHYDRISSIGPNTCFVCDKPFKRKHTKIHVGAKNGEKIYRHEKCDCHSVPWYNKFHGCRGLVCFKVVKKKREPKEKSAMSTADIETMIVNPE
jgi:hypothetical protein